MSDTPNDPKPEAAASPAPDAPANPTPSAPAAPTPNAESTGSRWTNLAIAVAVVTVGGFIAGRATSATPPQAVRPEPVPLDVAQTGKRLPADALRRMRVPMRRLNLPVAVGHELAKGPDATMGSANRSGRPNRGENPAVARALTAIEPKVESCVSELPEHSTRAVVVRYAVRADGTDGTIREAKMVYPRGSNATVEQCVVDALKGVRVPGLTQDTVGMHAFRGR